VSVHSQPAATKIRAGITAVGSSVPDYVLTNAELSQMVDTTDDWILDRTGIRERRILRGPLGTSHMAVAAARQALDQRGLRAQDLDLIICATVTPDMQFPATANLVAAELGSFSTWGFDLEAACSSFLYALVVGAQFIETGLHRRVLVIGADKMSSIIDYSDRSTCVIFGDGAGAVLLEPVPDGTGLQDSLLYSDGRGAAHLHQVAGGSRQPATLDTVRRRQHFVYQEGKPVFKTAVENMAAVTETIMQRNGLTADNLDWLVPHQANLRIIDATAQRAQLTPDKVMVNIQRYGNTTSATLPLCLADWQAQLRPGHRLVLTTFGGGFTWGAVYLIWSGTPAMP
jgi:3-oxoacyl-[acyl-carrier-protein] synthase-3